MSILTCSLSVLNGSSSGLAVDIRKTVVEHPRPDGGGVLPVLVTGMITPFRYHQMTR